MLYVFSGSDTPNVRHKAFAFAHKLAKGGQITSISPEDRSPGFLEDLAQGSSLFEAKQIIVLDTFSHDKDAFGTLIDSLPLLKTSKNHFVIIERTLGASEKKSFKKFADTVEDIEGKAVDTFNNFALADALIARDRRRLWLLFMNARTEGKTPEELIGTLFWQVKALRLASKCKNAGETGLKPFVYGKAKRALMKFPDIDALSRSLTLAYHEGHSGIKDIDRGLEGWILAL